MLVAAWIILFNFFSGFWAVFYYWWQDYTSHQPIDIKHVLIKVRSTKTVNGSVLSLLIWIIYCMCWLCLHYFKWNTKACNSWNNEWTDIHVQSDYGIVRHTINTIIVDIRYLLFSLVVRSGLVIYATFSVTQSQYCFSKSFVEDYQTCI